MKAGQSVREPKKHYLVFQVAILSFKSRLSFIAFFYSYLMVRIDKTKIDK